MKKNTHPQLYDVEARCVCGEIFHICSSQQEVIVAFCSKCHPFYSNKQQYADIEGRIDKFRKKYGNKTYL